MKSNKYVIIVDPISSSSIFSDIIKDKYGYETIAVNTITNLPDSVKSTFRPESFSNCFLFDGDIGKLIIDIEDYVGGRPDFILCGSEPGVFLFDKLSVHWDIMPNDITKSQQRRNKFLMQEQLRNDGLPCINQIKSSSLDEILEWSQNQDCNRFVVKPMLSFGTDSVTFCNDVQEITESFNNLIGRIDYSGLKNDEVLVQCLIEGDEFVVDAVSSNGDHYVVNMFKYSKYTLDNRPIYRSMETVDPELYPSIIDYVCRVLTSLGIRHGASHSEVILTNDGPVLVETGARMHGGLGPLLVEKCNSQSLIGLSIDSRLHPEKLRFLPNPRLEQYAVEYFLSSPVEGILISNDIESSCRKIESYAFTTCNLERGSKIEKTIDLVSSYGRVVLINKCQKRLMSDLLELKNLEQEGMLIRLDK
ncbi:ATP-grasp domain-containing protein [Vibrio cholerae]|nr:ATP-grasp domain-containing protein [Vibrio cholerae]EKB0631846.1 ATP-grasp domain-containing protein [Vibrio cholerae]EKF9855237.1 ATP-grasp domain-containing protein [Vibrio cholerae]